MDRLTGKSYSNGDASVTYYYDQTSYNGLTITNGKGQRTGMSDGSGQTAWSYDTMGRTAGWRRAKLCGWSLEGTQTSLSMLRREESLR